MPCSYLLLHFFTGTGIFLAGELFYVAGDFIVTFGREWDEHVEWF